MSLLDKLKEHFKSPCHNRSSKIAKKLCALVLATGMTIAPMALSACNCSTPNPDASTNPPIVNPDNGGTDIGGNNSGSGNGNNQTPGNNNGGSNNGGSSNENQIDISKFSTTLQQVLTNPYYNNLIEYDKAYFETNQQHYSDITKYYSSIPYGFLQEQGYHIESLKNGTLDCHADVYMDGGDLFIECRAETKASTNYYTCYVLKYTLTNQEKNELDILHSSLDANYKRTYYQAPFYIQQLSYNKPAKIISEKNIATADLQLADQDFGKNSYISDIIGSVTRATYIGCEEKSNSLLSKYIFQIHNRFNWANPKVIRREKIGQLTCYGVTSSGEKQVNGISVFMNSCNFDADVYQDRGLSKTVKYVTFYVSNGSNYIDILQDNALQEEFTAD